MKERNINVKLVILSSLTKFKELLIGIINSKINELTEITNICEESRSLMKQKNEN